MGWRTVADVRDHSTAKGTTYLVAVMLAERAPDETRIARPGIACLARDARCNRATAQRALRWLTEHGEIEPVAYETGGRGMATEYRILVDPESKGPQDAALSKRAASDRKGPRPRTKGPRRAAPTVSSSVSGDPPTSTSEEPNRTEGRPDAHRLCEFLTQIADEESRGYPPAQLDAAAWLLDNVDHAELAAVVRWGSGRTFWAPRVRTAGKLRQAWRDLRVEYRAAVNGRGRRSVGRSSHDLRAKADEVEASGH